MATHELLTSPCHATPPHNISSAHTATRNDAVGVGAIEPPDVLLDDADDDVAFATPSLVGPAPRLATA
eukprot:354548-Chlamydomonas_euryale.AAC.14